MLSSLLLSCCTRHRLLVHGFSARTTSSVAWVAQHQASRRTTGASTSLSTATTANLLRHGRITATTIQRFVTTTSSQSSASDEDVLIKKDEDDDGEDYTPPWNNPELLERATKEKSKKRNAFRSRQHVNPLARRFQLQTILSENWPYDMFDDLASNKPFFLDIGCSRGGFLVELCTQRPDEYNYLGLEIRPLVAHQAQERVTKHQLNGKLGFVGCNANVDLHRLLSILNDASSSTPSSDNDANEKANNAKNLNLQMVTIQFPDPHFKSAHAKRRVVTTELVTTLAEFMPPNSTIFLQSDIQSVLDDMRLKFREQATYFEDTCGDDLTKYVEDNIIGIPTEREVSVLEKDLPVYRSVFRRTETEVVNDEGGEGESELGM